LNNRERLRSIFENYRKSLAETWAIGYNNFTLSKIIAAYFNSRPFKITSEEFFSEIHYSTSIISILSLNNLYETRKTNRDLITIRKYLCFIKSNPSLFKTIDIETLNKEISESYDEIKVWEASISKICNLRDNLIAHLSKKFILNKFNFFRENEIEDREIEDLYNLANIIITRYSLYFDAYDIFQSMNILNKREVIEVIEKCKILED